MTNRDLLLNFVSQYKKPFSAELAANLTGLPVGEIERMLPKLIAEKLVKRISEMEAIYASCQRYNPIVGYSQKGNWRFDPQAASALLDLLQTKRYNSIRGIANDFGRSRQWVFVYMEALASQGNIGAKGDAYYVINKDNLSRIGYKIKPGILSDLRSVITEHYRDVRKKKTEKFNQEMQLLKEKNRLRRKEIKKARLEARQKQYQEYKRNRQANKLVRKASCNLTDHKTHKV